jgi:hypothetical protein
MGDETVVINLSTRLMIGLNGEAACLWQRLAAPLEAAAVVTEVRNAGAEPAVCATIEPFIRALVTLGLVEATPVGAPPEEAKPSAPPPAPFGEPRVLWSEALRTVAATCAHIAGQSAACDSFPTM